MNPLNRGLFTRRKSNKHNDLVSGDSDHESGGHDVVVAIGHPSDKPKKSKGPGAFARIFSDRDAKLYNLIPCIVLALYSLIGGGIFYVIEKNICRSTRLWEAKQTMVDLDDDEIFQALRNDSCIKTFWESLYFAGTVYTTIGYGTVVTCCGASRVTTIIYAIIGIPLTFLTLERMGRYMAAVVNGVYLEIQPKAKALRKRIAKSCCRRTQIKSVGLALAKLDEREFKRTKREFRHSQKALPIWLATLLIVTWMMSMSAILASKEGWSLSTGLYFTMVTVTTIGFGDMHQTRFELTLVYQLLMIFGLALFSMLVNLVQKHIEIVTDTFAFKMRERYKERLLAEEDMGSGEKGSGLQSSEKEFMKLAKESDPSYYRFLMGRDTRDRLAQELEAQIRMRNTRMQTDGCESHTIATQTREDDLYRGQMLWAKRQYVNENRAKARSGSEPPKGRANPMTTATTVRLDTPEPEASPLASPRPHADLPPLKTTPAKSAKSNSSNDRKSAKKNTWKL